MSSLKSLKFEILRKTVELFKVKSQCLWYNFDEVLLQYFTCFIIE